MIKYLKNKNHKKLFNNKKRKWLVDPLTKKEINKKIEKLQNETLDNKIDAIQASDYKKLYMCFKNLYNEINEVIEPFSKFIINRYNRGETIRKKMAQSKNIKK